MHGVSSAGGVAWTRSQLVTVKADLQSTPQGITRMLLTSIPYFREVIIMSFRCDHCGNSNTEIQSAGEIQREPFTPVLRAMLSSRS